MLLHKDAVFTWSHEQDGCMKKIKDILCSNKVLAFYDVTKDTVVHADSSQYGLGACITQEGRPIAYASRSLTPTESMYAQIEKELLSIVFACERFSQYIYGKKVVVLTVHKPLIPIFKKPLHLAPARIQRLLLRLQRYDIDTHFKPGKDHIIPDTLSRAYVNHPTDLKSQQELNMTIHSVVNNLNCSDAMLQKIRVETVNDQVLKSVFCYMINGWPEKVSDCCENAKLYWSVRSELVPHDGIILYNDRIVIPKVLQPDILSRLHTGHQGRVRCKSVAHKSVYWRGISSDIDNMIDKCAVCLSQRNLAPKETLINHEVPDRPFQKVGADILTIAGVDYQLIIDYFSKWVEICKFQKSPSSNDVIFHLKSVFSRFGIPEILFTDQASIYKSCTFDKFCTEYGITKQYSSSRYAQSNGQIERYVQHLKKVVKKCLDDGSNLLARYFKVF